MSSQIQAVHCGKGKHIYRVFLNGSKIGEFEDLHEATMAITRMIKGK